MYVMQKKIKKYFKNTRLVDHLAACLIYLIEVGYVGHLISTLKGFLCFVLFFHLFEWTLHVLIFNLFVRTGRKAKWSTNVLNYMEQCIEVDNFPLICI